MGFIKRLLGIGVTAGATVAAMKIAEKYQENKKNAAEDVNGDGKTDFNDTIVGVAQAAKDVYNDVAGKVTKAAGTVKDKAPDFVEEAKEEAAELAKEAKEEAAELAKEAKEEVAELAKETKATAKKAKETAKEVVDEIKK